MGMLKWGHTLFQIDVDIVKEVIEGLLAGKEVVYGKHTGHSIVQRFQLHFLLP